MGGLKMAIDGGTTPRTAYMYEPFEGESEVINYNRLDEASLRKYFKMAHELGWDIGIHCCGDRAQDMAVEALAYAVKDNPRLDARHNIIHAYFPTGKALEIMAEHRIAAVIQPTFIYYEGSSLFRDVGEKRAHNYKPVRKYLDNGIVVTSSSDVESTVSANPFPALYSLVTRKNEEGVEIGPDQKITREEALHTYTTAGTWLTREEHLKGDISAGKLADMAVLDRDFFAVPEEEIKEVKVEKTYIDGRCVWERK
jgi:predicted amidohydrolase YtcJ